MAVLSRKRSLMSEMGRRRKWSVADINMSRVHVHFIKEFEDEASISYRVESADFNMKQVDEPIAKITINRLTKSYKFEPLGELATAKVVPPNIYDLPSSECEEALRTLYIGYGYGGWTSRMAKVIRHIVASDDFPNEIRGVT